MIAKASDWYKRGWDLGIKDMTWVENTPNEVEFIVKTLGLKGNERILDLACGYGRHSLELARRGFEVVGVDITQVYVDDANSEAKKQSLNAKFYRSDIRDVKFNNEFDVVLSLADGAIGYLENDEENLKSFDSIARALKSGGKHFMDIANAEHAMAFFPKRWWEYGENGIALAEFEWDSETHTMLYGGADILYGTTLTKGEEFTGDPTRLYTLDEIKEIFAARGMKVIEAFSNYNGKPITVKEYQMMVYSQKE